MGFTIKKLTPELLDDYLYFFDNIVFTENPDWSKCYCYSFHFTGPAEQWTKKNNRAAVRKLISEGSMKGYLAYDYEKPIGWCNANNRENYQSLKSIYQVENHPSEKTCSIVCFLIHPSYRRKGIAKIFLKKIVQDYTQSRYNYLEAYPGKRGQSCEKNYKGHLSLYEQNNFKIINEYDNYYIVRKEL